MAISARKLPEPASEMVITDVEQLKAISDPLRLSLLERISGEPGRGWTAKVGMCLFVLGIGMFFAFFSPNWGGGRGCDLGLFCAANTALLLWYSGVE